MDELLKKWDKPPEPEDWGREEFVKTHKGWSKKFAKIGSEFDGDLAFFVRFYRETIDQSREIVSRTQ